MIIISHMEMFFLFHLNSNNKKSRKNIVQLMKVKRQWRATVMQSGRLLFSIVIFTVQVSLSVDDDAATNRIYICTAYG